MTARTAGLDRCAWPMLRLLGGWRLARGDVRVASSPAMQRLLALLALRGPQPRTVIAGLLWPSSSERQASGSLRELLFRVRRTVPGAVEADDARLRLGDGVEVDARVLVDWIDGLNGSHEALDALCGLLTAGDLLPDWDEPWVAEERARLREYQLHGLELLAQQRLEQGRHHEALQTGLAATSIDPLRESAHGAVLRAHLAMGNYGQAVRHYERLTEHLEEELGVLPSRELAGLLRERLSSMADPLRELLPPRFSDVRGLQLARSTS